MFLACLHLGGGPYPILQAYTWATMIVSYSAEDGILNATQSTFSGEKPCGLCDRLAVLRASDESEPQEPLPAPLCLTLLQDLLPAPQLWTARGSIATDLAQVGFTPPPSPIETGAAVPPLPPPRV